MPYRGHYRGRAQRTYGRRQQSRRGTGGYTASSGLFQSTNDPGLYVGTFTGEWFDRLRETIDAAEEVGGVVVFLRKNLDSRSGGTWRVTLAPNNNERRSSQPRRPQQPRQSSIPTRPRVEPDTEPTGDGAPEAEGWEDGE